MKRIFFSVAAFTWFFVACNNKSETKPESSAVTETPSGTSTVELPYKPTYPTDFNTDVSDANLLLALNTYKYWEKADMKSLRTTMGDSMAVNGWSGFVFNGRTDSLMKTWELSRDSLSSVAITMDAWAKLHDKKDSSDYITTWYKEIDTYKTGKVDSANYADINQVRHGKMVWYSSYRQKRK